MSRNTTITILTALLLNSFVTVNTSAETALSLMGIVTDSETGETISDAKVRIQSSSNMSFSNEHGRYEMWNIPAGEYALLISAPGYESTTLYGVKIDGITTTRVNVTLHLQVHQLDAVRVETDSPQRSDAFITLNRAAIDSTHASTLVELLETVPGLFVQETGTDGRAYVRIRGGEARHTLVLLDGVKLNPSNDGIADLSTVPLEMIERVEIHRGGASAEYGPDALGGVISISTAPTRLSADLTAETNNSLGAWAEKSSEFTLANPLNSATLSTRFSFSRHSSDGDFPFEYSVEPSNVLYKGERINNTSESNNYFGSAVIQLAKGSKLSLSTNYYESEIGLPDRAADQNLTGTKSDTRTFGSALWEHQFTKSTTLTLRGGYARYFQHFDNSADSLSAARYNNEYRNTIYNTSASFRITPFRGNDIRLTASAERDELNHRDIQRPVLSMDDSHRSSAGIGISVNQQFSVKWSQLFTDFGIDGALRHDWVTTRKEPTSILDQSSGNHASRWSPSVGAVLSYRSQKWYDYALRVSHGKSFRLPSINALFWKGDVLARGNPGLRPELSTHTEFGAEANVELSVFRLSGSVTLFEVDYTDLIVWVQGQGGWHPQNLQHSRTSGHEDDLRLSVFDGICELIYQNTITNSKNLVPGHNTYDKELTFTPHYQQSLTARVSYWWLSGAVTNRQVARRYALANNQKYYDAYSVTNFDFSAKFSPLKSLVCKLEYGIDNANDERYVLLTHYPMPGRGWHAGISLSYNPDNAK